MKLKINNNKFDKLLKEELNQQEKLLNYLS